jgi:hypothetical protein
MKTQVDTYRGWDISFDTEKQTFYTVSDHYDRSETKVTYNAIKTFIDDFIKENNEFKPVLIEKLGSWGDKHSTKLIGIRKDGRFICEDAKGKKGQISQYDEKDYFIVNSLNEPIFKAMQECEVKIQTLREEKDALGKTIIKKGLAEIKALYTI